MFGIGWTEILIILVVALLVLGPDRLPGIARSLGRGLRDLRKAMHALDEDDVPPRPAGWTAPPTPKAPDGPPPSPPAALPDSATPSSPPPNPDSLPEPEERSDTRRPA